MPVFREPQTGRIVPMELYEAGRIRTALKLGWHDVTPIEQTGGAGMPVLQNPKTGELAEIGIHEQERIAQLTKEGWQDVSGQPITVGIVVTEELKEPNRVGDPVLVVTEQPVEATEPQELPATKKPRRKSK